jgi:hypothetical protein
MAYECSGRQISKFLVTSPSSSCPLYSLVRRLDELISGLTYWFPGGTKTESPRMPTRQAEGSDRGRILRRLLRRCTYSSAIPAAALGLVATVAELPEDAEPAAVAVL